MKRVEAWVTYLQVAPLALVFLLFLVVPIATIVVVSFFDYDTVRIIPAFIWQNYDELLTSPVTWQTYLQPAALTQFTSGKWAGSALVQRYIALTNNAASAWLVDPAEIQYAIAGPVSIGASAYLYRPNGGSALTKIGPKVSVADKYGATELRVVHVNQGASTELQIRRLILF